MSNIYQPYNKEALKSLPQSTWIGGWKIDYLAFQSEDAPNQPPVVILGGAFQNFNSYKYWIEPLLSTGSVIFVDLPAMGANVQTHNETTQEPAETIALECLADLFAQWLTMVGISKIALMGMSLGSVVASLFASNYPQMMEKIILLGVMHETRPSWKKVIEESMYLLQQGDMDTFAQAVLLFLINHDKLEYTKLNALAKKMFYQQMVSFTENEKARYFINAKRLLRMNKIPAPECPVLIVSGQYDSFTLPYENANYALTCRDMQFGVILDADHLPQLERRKETMNLFIDFLKGMPLHNLNGIKLLSREELAQLERRRAPRMMPLPPCQAVVLRHIVSGECIPARLLNINYFGVLIQASDEMQAQELINNTRDYEVILPTPEGELAYGCLFFDTAGSEIRGLFKHNNFEKSDLLLSLLKHGDCFIAN